MLIDLGFCCQIDQQPCSYSGTLRYASDRVLRAWHKDEYAVKVETSDDVISLFYTMCALKDSAFHKMLQRFDPQTEMEKFIEHRSKAVTSSKNFARIFMQLQRKENATCSTIRSQWRDHFAPVQNQPE